MKITVLDVETTFQTDEKGNTDPSPYHPDNYLVSVGLSSFDENYKNKNIDYLCFQHNEQPTDVDAKSLTQDMLDTTDLLVWHHGVFDRSWLLECGFKVPFACWDTAIAEYTLSCGLKESTKLSECCKRRGVQLKKTDLVEDYFNQGISCEAIPWPILQEYGIGDLESTAELFWKQLELLGVKDVRDCIPIITPNN